MKMRMNIGMRPPRTALSLIAQAIAILRRYGGSLWVSDPAYTFTGSDGTGAAGEGSNAGYVRDLCATLGPELVTNGDFSAGTVGWGAVNASISTAGGELVVTGSGTISRAEQALTLTAGKVYEVTAYARKGTSDTSSMAVTVIRGAAGSYANVVYKAVTDGAVRFVFTAPASDAIVQLINGGAGTAFFDNIGVREIIGRPLFQATTGFKPKLKRVPKKLGPELVTNGDFSAGAVGWSVAGAGASISVTSGVVTITNGTGEASIVLPSTTSGKSYEVVADITALSGTGAVYFVPPSGSSVSNIPRAGVGQLRGTFVSGGGGCRISVGVATAGASFSIDNISVREVLEWGWAWVFDGVDDCLASVSSDISNSTDYTLVAAFASENRTSYRIALAVFASGGQDHMALLGEFLDTPFLSQYSRDINGPAYAGGVASGLSSSAGRRLRANGVDVASADYFPLATEPRAIRMGFGVGGDYLKGKVFASAYIPGVPSDAELLIVERAMAQLAGVTI